jgi:transcriptional regulator with XRE-family HTH domain
MIAERLKQERERLALTQDEFSAAAGAKRRTLVDWEKGVSSPTAMQLAELQTIGVDVAYVVTGERQGHGIGEAACIKPSLMQLTCCHWKKSRCAATSQSGR